jgi:hypothetical protein
MKSDPTVRKVIDAFGGATRMAAILGHRNRSTVGHWLTAKRIPPWRYHEIVAAARAEDIALPLEFLKRLNGK